MNKELYNYDNIDFNHRGLPEADNSNLEANNITSVSTETLKSLSVHTIQTVNTSDNIVTIDKDAVICKVCGRRLKDHHSRALGMGPMCYKQFKASRNKMFNLLLRKEINHG